MRFFFHFKTPFGVCNRSSLFSALFGHAVGNEYANVRRDGDADHVSMYTPFHACWHRQEATCCLPHMLAAPTIHHTHTHHRRNKHNRYDDSRFIHQSMNRSERLIRTFKRMTQWWTCHNKKKKTWNVHHRHHFSAKWYTISSINIDYCQSRFKYFSKIINVTVFLRSHI